VAVDDSNAVAEVAQEQGVTVAQVNECLNEVDVDDDGNIAVDEQILVPVEGSVSASAAAPAGSASAAAGSASAAATTVLPETGGASLLALGAGALLVAGGLVARRIVR
jgi:LPXTG-motif cell wall-anchored protein